MAKSREVGIRLSVKDADVAKRALEAFGKEGQTALKRIEAAGRPASVSLQALNAASGVGRSALSGLAVGTASALASFLSIGAAISGAKAALDEFGTIADQAKSTGLDAEFFQGFAYQAGLAGVETEALAGALGTFAKNAGLAAEGKGKMVTTLKALNPELLRNIQLATSQEERVRLAADAIAAAGSASEKAALASSLFGDQGVKLVGALEGGAAALDQTISKAKALGIVIDRETIARADALGDEFDTVQKVLDLQVKQSLVNLGPILVWLTGLAADWARAIGSAVEGTRSLQDQSSANLEARLKALNDARDVANPLGMPTDIFGVDAAERQKIEAELRRRAMDSLRTQLTTKPPATNDIPELPDAEAKKAIKEAEALIKQLQTATEAYASTMADLKVKQDAGLITQETYNRGAAEAALKLAQAADSSDEYAQALERLNEARAQGIVSEKDYTDAVEDLTKRRLTAQNDWLAGIQLGLMQISEQTDHVATDIANAVSGWADALGEQIGEAFRTGKFEWQDLVKTILADIARIATQQLITKPLSNLLGTLFGTALGGTSGGASAVGSFIPGLGSIGNNAEGTDFWRGGPTWVGERGPEILNLPRGSQIIPNSRIGWQTVQVNASYNINGSGLQPAQLLAVMEEHDKRLMSLVSDRVKKDMKNGAFG